MAGLLFGAGGTIMGTGIVGGMNITVGIGVTVGRGKGVGIEGVGVGFK
jgi:hypothetical protein